MEIIDQLVALISDLGILGLLIANFLMFAVFPLPSQVIVLTAGYLCSQGEMNLFHAIVAGTLGGFSGALLNYFVGRSLGLKLVLKYGEYVFINRSRIALLKLYFQKYGWISILVGLSLPSIGQLITLPAGVGKMNFKTFSISALCGAFIWNVYILLAGYYLGDIFLSGSPNM